MTKLRTLIGWTLLSLPFVAYLVLLIWSEDWEGVGMMAATSIILAVIIVGLYLISLDE